MATVFIDLISQVDNPNRVRVFLNPINEDVERHVFLDTEHPSITVGRASKHQEKSMKAARDNCWLNSPIASRKHARIFANFQEKAIYLQDTSSTHGTWVNGQRLHGDGPAALASGDRITIGQIIHSGPTTFFPKTFSIGCEWERVPATSGIPTPQESPEQLEPARTFSVPNDSDSEDMQSDASVILQSQTDFEQSRKNDFASTAGSTSGIILSVGSPPRSSRGHSEVPLIESANADRSAPAQDPKATASSINIDSDDEGPESLPIISTGAMPRSAAEKSSNADRQNDEPTDPAKLTGPYGDPAVMLADSAAEAEEAPDYIPADPEYPPRFKTRTISTETGESSKLKSAEPSQSQVILEVEASEPGQDSLYSVSDDEDLDEDDKDPDEESEDIESEDDEDEDDSDFDNFDGEDLVVPKKPDCTFDFDRFLMKGASVTADRALPQPTVTAQDNVDDEPLGESACEDDDDSELEDTVDRELNATLAAASNTRSSQNQFAAALEGPKQTTLMCLPTQDSNDKESLVTAGIDTSASQTASRKTQQTSTRSLAHDIRAITIASQNAQQFARELVDKHVDLHRSLAFAGQNTQQSAREMFDKHSEVHRNLAFPRHLHTAQYDSTQNTDGRWPPDPVLMPYTQPTPVLPQAQQLPGQNQLYMLNQSYSQGPFATEPTVPQPVMQNRDGYFPFYQTAPLNFPLSSNYINDFLPYSGGDQLVGVEMSGSRTGALPTGAGDRLGSSTHAARQSEDQNGCQRKTTKVQISDIVNQYATQSHQQTNANATNETDDVVPPASAPSQQSLQEVKVSPSTEVRSLKRKVSHISNERPDVNPVPSIGHNASEPNSDNQKLSFEGFDVFEDDDEMSQVASDTESLPESATGLISQDAGAKDLQSMPVPSQAEAAIEGTGGEPATKKVKNNEGIAVPTATASRTPTGRRLLRTFMTGAVAGAVTVIGAAVALLATVPLDVQEEALREL